MRPPFVLPGRRQFLQSSAALFATGATRSRDVFVDTEALEQSDSSFVFIREKRRKELWGLLGRSSLAASPRPPETAEHEEHETT